MKTLVTFKTEKKLKQSAGKLAAKFGLSLSDVINVSLKQFVDSRQLIIGEPWRMSRALEKTIAKAEADLAAGKVSPGFDNAEAAAKYLGI
jgi:antitoxin component of RelBE/YafQ-DinJ toxin-antitoxin module